MVSGAGPLATELQTAARIPHPLHQRVRHRLFHFRSLNLPLFLSNSNLSVPM
jgi:hypothetical protein